MKYLYNPATDEFESLTPTLRDRFDLKDQVADASAAVQGTEQAIDLSVDSFKAYQNAGGTMSYKDFIASGNEGVSRFFKDGGRVNFNKGSPFVITDEVLEKIDNLIKDTNLNLKEIGSEIGYGTETRGMTIDTPVMKKYIEKYGKPSDARLQTKGVPLSSDKGLGKKIVTAYDKQIKNFGKPDISKIAREVYGPGVKDLDSARAQVRSVLGRFRDYKGEANIPIDKKDLTAEQIKSKARVKKLKPVDNPTIAKLMAGPKDSGFQYHHMDATKTSMVTLNNVVYLPSEVNNYIQSYEGPISQRKKEITKLNKNKPKGYKKLIDTKLNQIRNTIAKADMDLDKAGYSAYKGVIEVDTIDVNGKPIKIGGGSALRLGEGLAEEIGLDSNKPLKNFSSEEQIKLIEAKKALIKKSSINKPKAKGLAKKGLKMGLKQLPLVGSAIGLYDMGKAVQAGVRNPLDLYTAYEVSPEVALKSKAMREDKTGKLLAEEMSNLPDISAEASLMDDLTPYGKFLQEGGQLSFEEFQKMQSIPQSERPITGELDLPKMDQTMMAAQGGRVGFQDGTSNPVFDQIIAALDNTDLINNLEEENKPTLKQEVYGEDGDRNLLQTFNTMFADPEAYPYYAQEIASGGANIPELAVRFPTALAYLFGKTSLATTTGDLSQIGMKDLKKAIEIMDPKVTKSIKEKIGFTDMLEKSRAERTGPQRRTGGILEFGAESVGPATPYFLIKAFPKIAKQVRNLVGTAASADKVNKELEKRLTTDTVDQTRRDILLATGAGGAMALLKYLGLDNLIKTTKAVKAAPEIVTKGGTPKYFFDFVNLIKTKGDDITDKAATLERQKVYDYNGYTMTEDISTGKISINKNTEGGASYYIGDGEYDTVDGIIRKEEIVYDPPETILDDAGKPKKVPDIYEENTLKPDYDGGDGDIQGGLDSIDEILELLAKSGEKYNLKELTEMGMNPEGLGPDLLKRILRDPDEIKLLDLKKSFKDTMNKVKYKIEKAEGGIISGVKSGPPPKSGPTPHGLPYVAKNVRPIKERK